MSNTPLSPQQIRAARARTVKEWMAIFMEVTEMELKRLEIQDPQSHTMILSNYQTVARPALRRVASAFEGAGLELSEHMEFEGVHPHPRDGFSKPVYETTPPKVTYIWPDGSMLTFTGHDAEQSVAFFLFWQNYQPIVTGIPRGGEAGQKRILTGGVDYDRYFKAKKADQQAGLEPT